MAQNFVRSSFSVHNVIVNQRIRLSFDVFLLYPGGITPLLNFQPSIKFTSPGGEGRAHQQFKCPGGVLLFLFDR